MFLLDQHFRANGRRSRVRLTLVTPEHRLEPIASPRVSQGVRQMLSERGVEVMTEAKVLAVEQGVLVLDHGVRVRGDLLLGVPPHWGPACLRQTDLVDGLGWVRVDPRTLQTAYPGVYCIGDAAGLKLPALDAYAPKAGVFAHYQAEVVARNIAQLFKGLKQTFRYTGKGACLFSTGFGRAYYYSIRGYHQPSPWVFLVRPTRVAGWAKAALERYWLDRFI